MSRCTGYLGYRYQRQRRARHAGPLDENASKTMERKARNKGRHQKSRTRKDRLHAYEGWGNCKVQYVLYLFRLALCLTLLLLLLLINIITITSKHCHEDHPRDTPNEINNKKKEKLSLSFFPPPLGTSTRHHQQTAAQIPSKTEPNSIYQLFPRVCCASLPTNINPVSAQAYAYKAN